MFVKGDANVRGQTPDEMQSIMMNTNLTIIEETVTMPLAGEMEAGSARNSAAGRDGLP
jgi:hypothetical protein